MFFYYFTEIYYLVRNHKEPLGSIISKYKNDKYMTFSVYTKLYTSCASPIVYWNIAQRYGECTIVPRFNILPKKHF